MLRFIQQARLINNFTQIKKIVTYPYLLGGLPQTAYPIKQQQDLEIVVMMQGQKIKENFRQAYLSYLDGLVNKDRDFLSNIVSKDLLENINFENVELINADKPIREEIDKEILVIGSGFDRDLHVGPWKMIGNEEENKYFQIYKTNTVDFKFSILFCVQVYFKSKMKLTIPNVATDVDRQQIHMIQFECERKQFPGLSIAKIIISEFWKSIFNRQRNYDIQIIKRILDLQNCEWKIGDVDRLLHGNFGKLRGSKDHE